MRIIWIILGVLLLNDTLISQHFTQVAVESGISLAEKNNGVGVADYDLDGDLDIFFTAINSFDREDPSTWNRLLRNEGNGSFVDVTSQAGLDQQFVNTDIPAARGEKLGASWGDYDNDGDPDLFLANSREDQLFRNRGDGTFEEVAETAGVIGCHECYSSCGLWWDHNRDGYLDLYVSILNGPNIMYQNNGDGTFVDVTEFEGLAGEGITWGAVTIDVGRDGYLDLYVINDTQLNEFFENRTGGLYTNAALAYRLADEGAGMGFTIGDPNNDGFFDMYVTNIFSHHPNPLFINSGERRFADEAVSFGVDNSGWAWGTHFFDCDHDGDEDLHAVNGPIDKLNGIVQADTTNYFFKNTLMENGVATYLDWSVNSRTNVVPKGKGMEVFDYDNDGDLDIVVANMEQSSFLFRNETIDDGTESNENWLQIKLEGTITNRDGFGSEVKVTVGDQTMHRWHHGGAIFGQSVKPVHFGLGESQVIDEIEVRWLSGLVENYYDITANQLVKIKEGTGLTTSSKEVRESSITSQFAFPNPFTDQTTLVFNLKTSGLLKLNIFDAVGQLIYSQDKFYPAGLTEILWTGKSLEDSRGSSGIYFYFASLDGSQVAGKLVRQ